jgi:hypothetical protein
MQLELTLPEPSKARDQPGRGVHAASTSELKDASGFNAAIPAQATLKRAEARAPVARNCIVPA